MLLSVTIPPLFIQYLVLSNIYPMLWAFPHFLPFLAVVALALADVWERVLWPTGSTPRRLAFIALVSLVVAGPMLYQAQGLIRDPGRYLHRAHLKAFHSAHVYAGFGNRDAVDYLLMEAKNSPLVLLADPILGHRPILYFPTSITVTEFESTNPGGWICRPTTSSSREAVSMS